VAVPQPASNQGEPVREDVAALQREQPEARTPAPAIDTRQNNPPVAAELPATASNWFAYLLGGALLLALAGLSFRAGARE
jgi:LPXTG-motif cell wall-anchored protein